MIGLLDIEAGKLDAAEAAIAQEAGEYYRLEGRTILAWARHRKPESDIALAQLISKYHDTAAFQVAQAYAYRGERDKAFEWLTRSFAFLVFGR